jgi:hypothetical protein
MDALGSSPDFTLCDLVQGSLSLNQMSARHRDSEGWRYGSSGSVSASQAQSPEFKPQY